MTGTHFRFLIVRLVAEDSVEVGYSEGGAEGEAGSVEPIESISAGIVSNLTF